MKHNKTIFILPIAATLLISCGGNGSTSSERYEAKKITTDTTITSGTFYSTKADENSLLVSGAITANLSNITVEKSGDSSGGDETSFYGTNSAILAKDKAVLTLDNISVTTNAVGGNGVFSYGGTTSTKGATGDGTTINVSNSTIVTTKDNSGGIMTTGGGITNATDLKITTSGNSSAAIRTDRGGGTVVVNKGTYTTSGNGSPAIYSTANVTATDVTLTSNHSEGIIIEGKNSVIINNSTLVDTNDKLNGKSTTYKNVFLYQSMSGDAETGVSSFTANNSNITTNVGDTFYVTNTKSTISLTNNTIKNNSSNGNFLRVQADAWGKSGKNGGEVTLAVANQTMNGNIVVDSISTLAMNMSSSSSYEGALNTDNSAQNIALALDESSNIKLTADSYVSSLEDADLTYSNINLNGHTLYVNGSPLQK